MPQPTLTHLGTALPPALASSRPSPTGPLSCPLPRSMGSAAILLTNKRSERRRAKYELQHVVRVHLGSDDAAYK